MRNLLRRVLTLRCLAWFVAFCLFGWIVLAVWLILFWIRNRKGHK